MEKERGKSFLVMRGGSLLENLSSSIVMLKTETYPGQQKMVLQMKTNQFQGTGVVKHD